MEILYYEVNLIIDTKMYIQIIEEKFKMLESKFIKLIMPKD